MKPDYTGHTEWSLMVRDVIALLTLVFVGFMLAVVLP